jgi:hypothetical protein
MLGLADNLTWDSFPNEILVVHFVGLLQMPRATNERVDVG